MSDELRPCPFCGSGNVSISTTIMRCHCNGCGAHGPVGDHKDKAIKLWNKAPRLKEVVWLPTDADGVPIVPGDVLYGRKDTPAKPFQDMLVEDLRFTRDGIWKINCRCEDAQCLDITKRWYSHEKPDSLEAIEKDIYHLVMSEYLDDPEGDVKAVMARIEKLMEAND